MEDKTPRMQATINQLLKAAEIINRKLHKLPTNNVPFNLCEESKYTRRNSQYKIEVLNIFWYVAYKVIYKKDPEPFDLYFNGRRQEEKRGHFNSFKNKHYTFEMTTLINRNNTMLVNHGLNEYFKNCKDYAMKQLQIKVVLKGIAQKKQEIVDLNQKHNFMKNDKKRYCGHPKQSLNLRKKRKKNKKDTPSKELQSSLEEEEVSASLALNAKLDGVNHELKLYSDKLESLKKESREPSILSKFYFAWLMECDLETLFVIIGQRLKDNNYPMHQMNKLLHNAINAICKMVLPSHQKEITIYTLTSLLKNDHTSTINKTLLMFSQNYKFSEYDIPEGLLNDNIIVLDIKHFPTKARNTRTIFYHPTAQQLEFDIVPYELNNENYCVIQYFDSIIKSIFFFDLVSCSAINKEQLSLLSWEDRLKLLTPLSHIKKIPKIDVRPIQREQIQFDKYPGAIWNYYIRTEGFGYGTLFFKSNGNNNNNKTRIGKNNSNKRHKKIREIDLDPTEQIDSNSSIETVTVPQSLYPVSSLLYGESILEQIRQQRQHDNKLILDQYMGLLVQTTPHIQQPTGLSIIQLLQNAAAAASSCMPPPPASRESCMNGIFSEMNHRPPLNYNFPTYFTPSVHNIANRIHPNLNNGAFFGQNRPYERNDLASLLLRKKEETPSTSFSLVEHPVANNTNVGNNSFFKETDSFVSYL